MSSLQEENAEGVQLGEGEQNADLMSSADEDPTGLLSDADIHYGAAERESEEMSAAEIRDNHGNVYTISMEELSAAGIDVDNLNELTEEQMNTLMSLVSGSSGMEAEAVEEVEGEEEDGSGGEGKMEGALSAEEWVSNQGEPLTISILPDGSLKLVATSGHESFFSASQLSQVNINATNLSDDDITRIVQLANSDLYQDVKAPAEKRRRKLEPIAVPLSAAHARNAEQYGQLTTGPLSSASSTSRRTVAMPGSIIGETVQIKRGNNKVVNAIVRYSRAGSGYKVQFPDGRFEWISADKIVQRTSRHSDHQSYTTQGEGTAGAAAVARPAPRSPARHSFSEPPPAPNFCCPVCDRKVFQKEPAYIVIRLPACDSCTREKILIVDEPSAEDGDKRQPTLHSYKYQ